MKKGILILLVMMMMAPLPGYANVLSGEKGEIDPNLKHIGSTDWNTGLGRHDATLKWAAGDSYLRKTVGMFSRGASNTLGGWSEVFIQPINWSKNSPVFVGQFNGLVMGVTMGTLRTASGIVDLTTFLIPGWRGVPMGKPALGLKNVHEFEYIEDVDAYDQSIKTYYFTDESW